MMSCMPHSGKGGRGGKIKGSCVKMYGRGGRGSKKEWGTQQGGAINLWMLYYLLINLIQIVIVFHFYV